MTINHTSTLDALVSSLLHEGYCLYPYTPGAVKNATPTPFGIVYPPGYAATQGHAFDHLQLECVLQGSPQVTVEGSALFLQASGPGHRAVERHVALPAATLESLARAPEEAGFTFERDDGDTVEGRVLLSAESSGRELWRLRLRVENRTRVPVTVAAELDRRAALERALLSTHALLQARGGRFVSPLEREGELGAAVAACRNSNTWPVLATPGDDAILGAAIFLPDHPEIAPESRVDFFDNTEIEEALVLHVRSLSEAERQAIGEQDQSVRDLIDRALTMPPEELMALHGVLRPVRSPSASLRTPAQGESVHPADNFSYLTRPRDDAGIPGEEVLSFDGTSFRRGGKVVLRLDGRTDPHERLLDGRTATVERLYLDYDDKPYLGVTVDGDPAQELMRESGRFLYFFPHEVEVVDP
ncbi:MAG: hypothetical protein ACREMX_14465 [Gemmatimonadales bacterium]